MNQEFDQYQKIQLLGEGSFGKAYLVKSSQDGSLCVIKQMDLINMTQQEKKETIQEARILQALQHPNIVRFRQVYKTTKNKLCIVMDYADGGDLAKKLKDAKGVQFSQHQILDWFTQLCLALKHVHDRKIIHRDIKTQNIFMTQDNVVLLGDFGIARVLSHTRQKCRTMVGTPYYLSPEIIENKNYSFATDVWSIGIVLYEMCALKPPFDGNSLHSLALQIVRGNYAPLPSGFSKELRNLLASMLNVDMNKRPSVNDILKMPIISQRIHAFLSQSMKIQEFSHTILHNQNFINNNFNVGGVPSTPSSNNNNNLGLNNYFSPQPEKFLIGKNDNQQNMYQNQVEIPNPTPAPYQPNKYVPYNNNLNINNNNNIIPNQPSYNQEPNVYNKNPPYGMEKQHAYAPNNYYSNNPSQPSNYVSPIQNNYPVAPQKGLGVNKPNNMPNNNLPNPPNNQINNLNPWAPSPYQNINNNVQQNLNQDKKPVSNVQNQYQANQQMQPPVIELKRKNSANQLLPNSEEQKEIVNVLVVNQLQLNREKEKQQEKEKEQQKISPGIPNKPTSTPLQALIEQQQQLNAFKSNLQNNNNNNVIPNNYNNKDNSNINNISKEEVERGKANANQINQQEWKEKKSDYDKDQKQNNGGDFYVEWVTNSKDNSRNLKTEESEPIQSPLMGLQEIVSSREANDPRSKQKNKDTAVFSERKNREIRKGINGNDEKSMMMKKQEGKPTRDIPVEIYLPKKQRDNEKQLVNVSGGGNSSSTTNSNYGIEVESSDLREKDESQDILKEFQPQNLNSVNNYYPNDNINNNNNQVSDEYLTQIMSNLIEIAKESNSIIIEENYSSEEQLEPQVDPETDLNISVAVVMKKYDAEIYQKDREEGQGWNDESEQNNNLRNNNSDNQNKQNLLNRGLGEEYDYNYQRDQKPLKSDLKGLEDEKLINKKKQYLPQTDEHMQLRSENPLQTLSSVIEYNIGTTIFQQSLNVIQGYLEQNEDIYELGLKMQQNLFKVFPFISNQGEGNIKRFKQFLPLLIQYGILADSL